MPKVLTCAELVDAENRELVPSEWRTIDQERINAFANATDDHQWIHVDPDRAATSVWGSTLAHGYLVLSLIPSMLNEILAVSDQTTAVNYGIDKLRFTGPVRAGSRIRLHATIREGSDRGGAAQYVVVVSIEVEGSEKPALMADVIFLAVP